MTLPRALPNDLKEYVDAAEIELGLCDGILKPMLECPLTFAEIKVRTLQVMNHISRAKLQIKELQLSAERSAKCKAQEQARKARSG